MKTATIILAALALVACGPSYDAPDPDYWTEGGIGIKVEPGAAEWAYAPDLGERVDKVAQAVAEYADRSEEDFRWIVIVFQSGMVQCGTYDDGSPYMTTGCHHGPWIDITTDYPESFAPNGTVWHEWTPDRVEDTALNHEFLHVLIGDDKHLDRLWDGVTSVGRGS
jgi:hypothetical protein